MSNILIRKATVQDAALIAAISRETFYDSFAAQNTPEDMELFMAQQFSEQILMQELFDPAHIFFLAYIDEEIVGYTKLKPGAHHELDPTAAAIEMCRFYARKNSIGKGIGKAMMQYALQYAAATQYKIVWLGVWEHNTRAIDFYQRFGFEKFSAHDFILGKDVQKDWLMRKIVSCE